MKSNWLGHQRKTPVGKLYNFHFFGKSMFFENEVILWTYDDSETWHAKCSK